MRTAGIVLLIALAGCSAAPKSRGPEVHHVVLWWLKDPGDSAKRQQMLDAIDTLRSVPGVLDVAAGFPVPSKRKVVDNTFDVAMIVTFADVASKTAYLTNPIHDKAADEVFKPLSKKLLVYNIAR